jgi:hypothetical protein
VKMARTAHRAREAGRARWREGRARRTRRHHHRLADRSADLSRLSRLLRRTTGTGVGNANFLVSRHSQGTAVIILSVFRLRAATRIKVGRIEYWPIISGCIRAVISIAGLPSMCGGSQTSDDCPCNESAGAGTSAPLSFSASWPRINPSCEHRSPSAAEACILIAPPEWGLARRAPAQPLP